MKPYFINRRQSEGPLCENCVKTQFLMLRVSWATSQVRKMDSSTPARLPRWGPRPVPASNWADIQLQITNSRSVTPRQENLQI